MRTEKIIIILVLIFTFSCKKEKNNSEKEFNSDTNPISKNHSKNITFRNLTDLKKYNGFEEVSAQVLGNSNKALAYIQKDSLQVLILKQIIKNNSNKVKFKILDEVQIIADKTRLFSEPAECELNDKQNPEEKFIFGIINDQEKEFFDQDHILKVWKVDLTDNNFKEIDKKKVKCFNHWYGYDG